MRAVVQRRTASCVPETAGQIRIMLLLLSTRVLRDQNSRQRRIVTLGSSMLCEMATVALHQTNAAICRIEHDDVHVSQYRHAHITT